MYSIGEVSKLMHLPIPTIRYYDEEGLLPNVKRDKSGNRIFDEGDLNALNMIGCLKMSGLRIKEIKDFMDLCKLGNESLKQRLDFFIKQEKVVLEEMENLEKCLALVKFKQWFYQTAIDHKDENYVRSLCIEDYPNEIRELYLKSHKN